MVWGWVIFAFTTVPLLSHSTNTHGICQSLYKQNQAPWNGKTPYCTNHYKGKSTCFTSINGGKKWKDLVSRYENKDSFLLRQGYCSGELCDTFGTQRFYCT